MGNLKALKFIMHLKCFAKYGIIFLRLNLYYVTSQELKVFLLDLNSTVFSKV